MEDRKIKVAFDCTLRKPGCVLIQAMLGGDSTFVGHVFDATSWLLAPTPDMHVYNMPESHWRKVAEVVMAENPLPEI